MKTKTTHTPRPWHLSGEFKQDLKTCTVTVREMTHTPDDKRLPNIAIGWIWADDNSANAEFIVRACNSHDELLDTLILALPYVETALLDESYKPGCIAKMVKQIRDMIAKAEGK